jgi:hypothetical protein
MNSAEKSEKRKVTVLRPNQLAVMDWYWNGQDYDELLNMLWEDNAGKGSVYVHRGDPELLHETEDSEYYYKPILNWHDSEYGIADEHEQPLPSMKVSEVYRELMAWNKRGEHWTA